MERTPDVPPSAFDEYKLRDALKAAQEELLILMEQRELTEWWINKLHNETVLLAVTIRDLQRSRSRSAAPR